jgi:hypothetical protein
MQIIWNQEAADKLRGAHTVLELETFEVNEKPVTTYCVVPAEKIGLNEFASLEQNRIMHAAFIDAYKNKNVKLCEDLTTHLMGKFGGELDSFYEEILKRIR